MSRAAVNPSMDAADNTSRFVRPGPRLRMLSSCVDAAIVCGSFGV
jgi:hypothetical protein